MRTTGKDIAVPTGAQWVTLTDDLLESSNLDEWLELMDRFEPDGHGSGDQTMAWLREGVGDKTMGTETHVLRTEDMLLGLVAVTEVQVKISRRDRVIFELHKHILKNELEAGLMLTHFAPDRSADGGTGHLLFDRAVGIALSRPPIVAVCVQPSSEGVSLMWQRDYHLRAMDKPETAGLLYFPIGPKPIPHGPS